MWPAIIGGAASLLGTIGSITGARETNASNVDMARETNAMNMSEASRNRDFQAQQANAQMAFQERMSNTAWQRESADMKKAGFNPILMKAGGAPVPAGASGSGSAGSAQAISQQNPLAFLTQAVGNVTDLVTKVDGLKTAEAQRSLLREQTMEKKKGAAVGELWSEAADLVRPVVRKTKEMVQQAPKFFKEEWEKTKKLENNIKKQFNMPNFFGGMR